MSDEQIAARDEDVAIAPSNLLTAIATAVSNPNLDIEKMKELLSMHERIVDEQRKTAFAAALARLQAKLPQIDKHGQIMVKGQLRSTYARIEDMAEEIQGPMAEEGFAFTFDTDAKDDRLLISCKLLHQMGHSETKSLLLPIDKSEYRSNVQSIGSTISYGKRQLIKMHLNITERGLDDDGQGGSKLITEDQARDLEIASQDAKMDRGKFLVFMGVGDFKDILARDLNKATNAINVKKRDNEEKARLAAEAEAKKKK